MAEAPRRKSYATREESIEIPGVQESKRRPDFGNGLFWVEQLSLGLGENAIIDE